MKNIYKGGDEDENLGWFTEAVQFFTVCYPDEQQYYAIMCVTETPDAVAYINRYALDGVSKEVY